MGSKTGEQSFNSSRGEAVHDLPAREPDRPTAMRHGGPDYRLSICMAGMRLLLWDALGRFES